MTNDKTRSTLHHRASQLKQFSAMISCFDHVLHRTGNRIVCRLIQLPVLAALVTTFDRKHGAVVYLVLAEQL
ncbi:hypothetical protein [Bordetella trematum]|uniref:hypothetical protein n=1 Tax=Bordetella trematum TaxID=123899 RepID=UPI0013FD5DBD|nr:hypothetical protein [Bordetella trematum]